MQINIHIDLHFNSLSASTRPSTRKIVIVFCVGIMYSSEYDVCEVTLSVYPHRASLKNMPGHSGKRTYDLWYVSPMLCQLSYVVRSVQVCDIWEYTLRVTSQTSKIVSCYTE